MSQAKSDSFTIKVEQRDAFKAIQDRETDSCHVALIDPWDFDTKNGSNRFGHDQSTGNSNLYDTSDEDGLKFILKEVERVVKDGGWVFVFADDEKYPTFRNIVTDVDGLERRQTIYWDSDSMGMGYYHRVQTYPLVTATVGKTERYVQSRPNIYRAHHHSPSAEYHTQKPVELYSDILTPPIVREGETVLEPFAGTFPSGVVAEANGFNAIGWDVNEEALEIVSERLGDGAVHYRNGGNDA